SAAGRPEKFRPALRMKFSARLPVVALARSAMFCVGALVLRAQPAPMAAPPAEEPAIKLERIEVTGSYIPFASTQTALPLTSFDARAIADTGIATNVLEVLRKIAPQFTGNGNLGNSNANSAGGATEGGSKLAFRNTQT